jgi:hypothetical protein
LQLGLGSTQPETYSTPTPAALVPDLSSVLAISVGGVSQFVYCRSLHAVLRLFNENLVMVLFVNFFVFFFTQHTILFASRTLPSC